MKKQNGVTLISLTIYVISLTIIIAMLSSISTFFYKNINDTQEDITPLTEFTSFNTYFSEDANASNVIYLTIGENTENGQNQYRYIALVDKDSSEIIKYIYVKDDKVIYRVTGNEENKAIIAIARNVTNCEFEKLSGQQNNNSKTRVKIIIKIGENTTKEYTYSLSNN